MHNHRPRTNKQLAAAVKAIDEKREEKRRAKKWLSLQRLVASVIRFFFGVGQEEDVEEIRKKSR